MIMIHRLVLVAIICAISAMVAAQEQLNLTVPKTTPNVTGYAPRLITIDVAEPAIRVVITANSTGQAEEFLYPCSTVPSSPNFCTSADTPAEVTTLINNLNTANLTTRSLWRRVMDRLCADFPSRFPGGCSVP